MPSVELSLQSFCVSRSLLFIVAALSSCPLFSLFFAISHFILLIIDRITFWNHSMGAFTHFLRSTFFPVLALLLASLVSFSHSRQCCGNNFNSSTTQNSTIWKDPSGMEHCYCLFNTSLGIPFRAPSFDSAQVFILYFIFEEKNTSK